ncbi:enoyl-CoA hydratase-related protein [Nocardioides zeae]|uniref:Enoyl-CoA hydratase-related protein n=1 Tax=Nocardioides imazamoxiresistens TaxID=3231893 RepID=A0ABU3PSI7_9ACTN|nr:enoyl-CoA hydratase-related protein [Nocardioides zeae]MDT9592154.1 enoyl-CoA hydratase-related protein [Nocardioides zeae]
MSAVVTRVGPVPVVELDRPHRRNAIDAATTAALDAAFDRLEDDPTLRAAVLGGRGPAFCAGSDVIDGPGTPTARGGWYGVVRRGPLKPVVAAVDGPALGGGFELVLACDLVVASTAASFGLPEATRARLALAGGLFRAADRLPRNVATELLLTGGRLDAARAHALGLVNRLVAPGDALATAVALATDLCRDAAPTSVEETLRVTRRLDAAAEADAWAATAAAAERVAASPDRAEGTAAFRERRAPRWT